MSTLISTWAVVTWTQIVRDPSKHNGFYYKGTDHVSEPTCCAEDTVETMLGTVRLGHCAPNTQGNLIKNDSWLTRLKVKKYTDTIVNTALDLKNALKSTCEVGILGQSGGRGAV